MDQKVIVLKCFFLIFSIFILKPHCNAQQVQGKGLDTLQNPLPYANILAIPNVDDQYIKFAITEKDGSYKLGLVAKINSV